MKRTWLLLASLLLSLTVVSPYSIDGIFPDCGPTTGDTRVTIYSPTFKGMNHSDHPNPQCIFGTGDPQPANWIHCYGSKSNPSSKRDQTCLNCESTPHAVGKVDVKVSISGTFNDTATIKFTYYVPFETIWAVPSIGYKTGGTFVQVYGTNFTKTDHLSCAFGTVNVRATYVSPTLVTCRSPPSDVVDSSIPLKVSQNDQQYSLSKIRYYYHSVPEVSALIPGEGPISGGTEVYIKGRQIYPFVNIDAAFDNSTFARFGNNYVPLTLVNKTHAKVISPPSASGSPVPVEITFNNQEFTSNGILFHYYQAPYVVKLVPDIGKLGGGTNLTVVGANLYNSSDIKCRFGNTTVPGHFINQTAVWCTVPKLDNVGPYDFSLSIENDHYSGNKIKYLAIKEPVVTSVSPLCGPTTGFTQLTVVGRNFVFSGINRVSCIFGDVFRQPATVINETLIYCDTPRVLDRFGNNINDTTSLHFKVTLNDVEVVDTKYDFTYYTTPVVTSVEPKIGPLAGGVQVAVNGNDFSNSCGITCRFATSEVPGVLSANKSQVICVSPPVACQGDSLVQVSLNGQQYDEPSYVNDNVVFTNYVPPVVAYSLPKQFPANGDSSVGIYGEGFLLSKDTAKTSTGADRISYQCRFLDNKQNVLGVSTSEFFNDYYIHCKTPSINSGTSGVNLQVSTDGQNWISVPNSNITFYEAPAITDISPKFGKVKQEGAVLQVSGNNFDCPEGDCSNVKCAFTSPNFKILTKGVRQSSQLVNCEIPAVSMPENAQVQVTMNGVDFTSQKVYYTFYGAFVVGLNPPYVPLEGNTTVKVLGFGFANSSDLLVRLQDPRDGSVLQFANSTPCVFPATYVSPNEMTFNLPAQNTLRTASGQPFGFNPFQVETSVYGDDFTQNGVQLNYFQNPTIGGNDLQIKGGSYAFHSNATSTIFIPINVTIPPGVREEEFLRKTRPLCKYSVNGQQAITEGKLVQYPYPLNAKIDASKVSIECATPKLATSGNGTVGVSLNGVDFSGALPVSVAPQLKITSMDPKCGPIEGGTFVNVGVDGIQNSDIDNNVAFTWSTVSTSPLTSKSFVKSNTVLSAAPPATPNSTGGTSRLTFNENENILFDGNQIKVNTRSHLETSSEFLYYKRPVVTRVFPHGGVLTGGTPITVEGAGFFQDDRFNATPKCKFGKTIVNAEVLSSTRLQCISPPGKLGDFSPLSVTVNGQDEADSVQLPNFAYISTPNIASISPTIGPATGGTMLEINGKDFVDMSRYPDEFSCIFKPIDSNEEPKIMPASYINSTAVACSTPGGWRAGTTTNVELSFNGVDFSNNKKVFRFYQVNKISPLSGPSSGGTTVKIQGSGLIPVDKKGVPACRVGGIVANATSVSSEQIVFQLPQALEGPDFNGHADFYYTLDGEKWQQVVPGFTFYQQPEISEVSPKFVSANGGRVTLKGKNFKENFYDANLTCRIDNTTVPGIYVSETEANCPFNKINLTTDAAHHVQVSLNGETFTPETDATAISVFKVSSINPPLGVVQGGTQLTIIGHNFPANVTPTCKFGVPGRYGSSVGTLVSDRKLICTAPAMKIPKVGQEPYVVPVSVSFGAKDDTKTWDQTGLHYSYYIQPEVTNMVPEQVPMNETTLVVFTSSDKRPFNNSIVGSIVTQSYNKALEHDIACRFGRFGTTRGALLSPTEAACPTPNIDPANYDANGETVEVELSLNNQDFMKIPTKFKFTPAASATVSSSEGAGWIMTIMIGTIALIFAVRFFNKMSDPFNGESKSSEKTSLAAGFPKSDDPNAVVQEEMMPRKVIV